MRLKHDYQPLIGQWVTDEKRVQLAMNWIKFIIAMCGLDHIEQHKASDIGSPAKISLDLALGDGKKHNLSININDLPQLYYFFQIERAFRTTNNHETPLIVEIGGGFGNMITKLKNAFPKARCVLLDLPEISAVQSYYLYNEFPDKKILYYKDWLDRGEAVFAEEFDFLIAPGWMINKIPDHSADLVLNLRSMMEMTNEVINYYFDAIQRITRQGGLFACYNRYHKDTSGDVNLIKHYPFDDHWGILLSQTSTIQPTIHELIVQRLSEKNQFPLSESLKSLPPY